MTYRLADSANRSWTPLYMSQRLNEAQTEDDFWDVLAMNHRSDAPQPKPYDPKTWDSHSKEIPLHRIHSDENFGVDGVDVFIAGSGPLGATYARKLVDAGLSVVMCELGATDTKPAASHKKNEIEYQKDIDRFVNVIKGALSPVSIPKNTTFVETLNPASWNSEEPFVTNGKNPRQRAAVNLSAQAVTRGTGGMATHWTCAVPHFKKGVERPVIHPKNDEKDDEEWKSLYEGAGNLVYRSESEFDEVSIRHTLVLNTLKDVPIVNPPAQQEGGPAGNSSIEHPTDNAPDPVWPKREFRPLPLAARRLENSPRYVEWMSAESVFGDLILQQHVLPNERRVVGISDKAPDPTYKKRFRLLTNHRVTRYALNKNGVVAAEVQDLIADRHHDQPAHAPINFYIKAKYFVTAAGAVANPQILFNSGLNNFGNEKTTGPLKKPMLLPALGRYITEQPMAFCQVVLKRSLVDMVPHNPWGLAWWQQAYDEHVKEGEGAEFKDPLPFPRADPEPQITSPVDNNRPWHTQIHRDAFSYGAVAASIDSRLVVDLRWFGRTQPVKENVIRFERDLTDAYGMPQPTFEYRLDARSTRDAHLMMTDMCEVAQKIGGYLPGSEPQFMAPGLALHLGGTTRLGHNESDSCANFRGQVHGFHNLYVAGNGVIDTAFAANPTLTSMSLGIYSAEEIATKEGKQDGFKRNVPRERKPWPQGFNKGAPVLVTQS